jgi:hypothetical protein
MLVIALGIAPAVVSAEGDGYGGVNPESDSENLPPKVEEIPEGAVMLTWPGFMMNEDGSSTFFVQTSKEVRYGTTQSKGQFELVIHDIRVHLKTNYLPLETQYFDTPVTRATVQRSGKRDVTMVFEMRKEATPTITQKKGKDGFNYVFVKFGKPAP